MISVFRIVYVQTFWRFGIVSISRTQGTDAINIVQNSMKLRYVKVFSDPKLDNSVFVVVKSPQARIKGFERHGGVVLQL